MSSSQGVSGPRRRYERAPSDDHMGDLVENTNGSGKNMNGGTTFSSTEVDYGDGVDLDFSIIKTRQDHLDRTATKKVTVGVISFLMLFLVFVVKPNANYSQTPELFHPNYNVNELCSKEALLTTDGRTTCKAICSPVLCCFSSDADNCFIENRGACTAYSGCEVVLNDQQVFNTKIENKTDIKLEPAPHNIQEVCSASNVITAKGRDECEVICEGGSCCLGNTCGGDFKEECEKYEICKSAGSSVSAVELVQYTCSLSKIGNISPVLSALERDKNIDECRQLCEPRECCFSNGPNNCYSDNSLWCDEFAPCKTLSNTDLDSPPPSPSKEINIKDDCDEGSTSSSTDTLKCEEACMIASCCFSEEGCGKKGVNCADYSNCKRFIYPQEDDDSEDIEKEFEEYEINISSDCGEESILSGSDYLKCEEACLIASCCFSDVGCKSEGINCADYIFCEKFADTGNNEDILIFTEELNIVSDCDAKSVQSNEDFMNCQQACLPFSCCFSDEGCGMDKDIDCTIAQNCGVILREGKHVEGQMTEQEIDPKEVEKVVEKNGTIEGGNDGIVEENKENTQEENMGTESDDYFNIEKIDREREDDSKSTPQQTTGVVENDDYYSMITSDIEKTLSQKVNLGNDIDDDFSVESIVEEGKGEISKSPPQQATEEENDDKYYGVMNEDIEKTIGQKVDLDDDYFNIESAGQKVDLDDDYFNIENAEKSREREKEEQNLPGPSDDELMNLEDEIAQSHESSNNVEETNQNEPERPNLSSLEPALESLCNADEIDDRAVVEACKEACAPARCCVEIMDEDCTVANPEFCNEFIPCNPFWEMEGFTPKVFETTGKTPNDSIIHEEIRNSHGETVDVVDVVKTEVPGTHATDAVCSLENIAMQEGYNQCVLHCNPALCCAGIQSDCSISRAEFCREYQSCENVWSVGSEISIPVSTVTTSSPTSSPSSSPSERYTFFPSIDVKFTVSPTRLPEHSVKSSKVELPKEPISTICSERNTKTQGGLSHCVLECNKALCCIGLGSDCYVSQMDVCDEFIGSCNNVWSGESEVNNVITSEPSLSPSFQPTQEKVPQSRLPQATGNINTICSEENVETKGGFDHCVLECNQALCCIGVGKDCSKKRREWCDGF